MHQHLFSGQDSDTNSTSSPEPVEAQGAAPGQSYDSEEVAKFPGHMAFLCQSYYFESQVRFEFGDGDFKGCRPTLNVMVDDASHLPAVEEMYEANYAVSKLPQHQIAHVVQYADIMQLDLVLQDAVQLLVSAVQGQTKETLDVLCQITWPDCLLPLLPVFANSAVSTDSLQKVLLSMLSNLETVWAVEKLSSTLLKLPLTAVQLLLGSDQLQVYSEDSIMYTAVQYITAQPDQHQQQEAFTQLSQLVRAPHMSDFHITAQALNDPFTFGSGPRASKDLQPNKRLLTQLLNLKRFGPVTASDMARVLPTAPQSWQLPPRQILSPPADGFKLSWHLPVSEVIAAYNTCREKTCGVDILSKSVTAPICGTAWMLMLQCTWDEAGKGVRMGVYSLPLSCPDGVIYKKIFSILGPSSSRGMGDEIISPPAVTPQGCGWTDFFGCGDLQGPFEKSSWVDKGLPVTGDIVLGLTIYEVL